VRGHEDGFSLPEILVAALLIGIALVPLLELYPATLGFNVETEIDAVLSAVAVRKMEENITLLRAPTFDASTKEGSIGASMGTNASITIGASANYIVIQIGILGMTEVSSVTVGGTSATRLLARNHGSGTHRSELWRLLNPPTGTMMVTVTMTAPAKHSWVAASFRGVLSATPLGGNSGNDGTSTTPTVTITPRTANSMMVGGFLRGTAGGAITQGGGQTAIDTAMTTGAGGENSRTHLARETNPGGAGIDLDWTVSGAAQIWVALAVELRRGAIVADPNGSAACPDLPNCLLVWTTTTEFSSAVAGAGTLKTLNVVACQDANGSSACDSSERQVRYDAKITSRP
jgi:prepilin-type N-terminal cleavage/methylation domain-containing protein